MGVTRDGIEARPEASLLVDRAARYLENGPADAVDLIGHICNLPRAPRIVADHMARAMFEGRREFDRDSSGRWFLAERFPAYEKGLASVAPARSRGTRTKCVPSPEPLSDLSYVVVDVETTGGRPPWDRITEIAAVVVENGKVSDVFETLVNPGRPIPAFVTRLTNISWEMVRHAPRFAEVAPRVMQALEGNVFVAHNAAFDWRFVRTEMRMASGRDLTGRRLCTVKLARLLLPHLRRRSLDFVANYYGVEITSRHRAAGDAVATARCLIRLLDDAAQRGCVTWHDLDLLLVARSRPRRKRYSALPAAVDKDTTA